MKKTLFVGMVLGIIAAVAMAMDYGDIVTRYATATMFYGDLEGNAATASAVAVGGITGLGSNVSTFLETPSSANLASALTGETGTGAAVFGTSPTFTTQTSLTNTSGTKIDYVYSTTSLAADAAQTQWKRLCSWSSVHYQSTSFNLRISGYESSSARSFGVTVAITSSGASCNIFTENTYVNGKYPPVYARIAGDSTTHYLEILGNATYTNTLTAVGISGHNITPLEFTDGASDTEIIKFIIMDRAKKMYIYSTLVDVASSALRLITTPLKIGTGAAGVDYTLTFDGETNDGTLTYMEDENRFDFANHVFPSINNTKTLGGAANNWAAVYAYEFYDATPAFEGDAIDELLKVKSVDGKIDHSSLPKFAQNKQTVDIIESQIVKDDKGEDVVTSVKTGTKEVETRSIGAMVSILTKAIQELATENTAMKSRLDKLEGK